MDRFLHTAANALSDAADQLHRDNDRAEMPRAKFCRDKGCPCADDCPEGCYLLACNDGAE